MYAAISARKAISSALSSDTEGVSCAWSDNSAANTCKGVTDRIVIIASSKDKVRFAYFAIIIILLYDFSYYILSTNVWLFLTQVSPLSGCDHFAAGFRYLIHNSHAVPINTDTRDQK